MSKEIYIICDKLDRPHEKRLRTGLQPILQRFDLTLWSRNDIQGGARWIDEMKKHLARTAFVIVLVSADTLASNLCNKEIEAALYRAQNDTLKIISILCRPSLFEYSKLAQHAFLPQDGKYITESNSVDKAWQTVLRDLLAMIVKEQRYLKEE